MNQSYFYLKCERANPRVPYTGKDRRVRSFSPVKNTRKTRTWTYPVVYFHDGQNVFYEKNPMSVIHGNIGPYPLNGTRYLAVRDCCGYWQWWAGRMNRVAWHGNQESNIPGHQFGGSESSTLSLSWKWSNPYRWKPSYSLTASIPLFFSGEAHYPVYWLGVSGSD